MIISIIVAVAKNNVIGKDNSLIWHISEDLKRFKKLTSGHPIIMGRKTYESLPFKPLPKRKNIVISSQKDLKFEGATVVDDFSKALKECEEEKEVFICGGASVYKHFINITDKIFLTKVHHNFEGDTYFPETDFSKWEKQFESEIFFDEKSKLFYSFINYIKNTKIKLK